MNPTTSACLTLRLQIETKDQRSKEIIDSFSELGFTHDPDDHIWEFECARANSLTYTGWSKLWKLVTSLSPTTLNLSCNGSDDTASISQSFSYGIRCSGNTSVSAIAAVFFPLMQFLDGMGYLAREDLFRHSSKGESVRARFHNGGW